MFKLTSEVPENTNIMSLYESLIQNILYYIFHISFSNFFINKEMSRAIYIQILLTEE